MVSSRKIRRLRRLRKKRKRRRGQWKVSKPATVTGKGKTEYSGGVPANVCILRESGSVSMDVRGFYQKQE